MRGLKLVCPTVLVADDDAAIVFVLEEVLKEEGFRVLTAHNGADAVRLSQDARPDLVVMDLMMPVLSGPEAIRRLKGDQATGHIPVIAISAVSRFGDALQGLLADRFLAKPFDLDRLMDIVAELITGQATQQTASPPG